MHAVTQSCLTLCDPTARLFVHGIFQARILEWVAISSFRGSSWPRDGNCVSCIAGRFFATEPLGKPDKSLTLPLFTSPSHNSCVTSLFIQLIFHDHLSFCNISLVKSQTLSPEQLKVAGKKNLTIIVSHLNLKLWLQTSNGHWTLPDNSFSFSEKFGFYLLL